jgi:hypothetical protein
MFEVKKHLHVIVLLFRFGHNEFFFFENVKFCEIIYLNEITKEMKILKMVETQELLA